MCAAFALKFYLTCAEGADVITLVLFSQQVLFVGPSCRHNHLHSFESQQVLVWSGVAASSSFPGLYPPQFLVGRNSQGQICR
jgi:hypothetical protein